MNNSERNKRKERTAMCTNCYALKYSPKASHETTTVHNSNKHRPSLFESNRATQKHWAYVEETQKNNWRRSNKVWQLDKTKIDDRELQKWLHNRNRTNRAVKQKENKDEAKPRRRITWMNNEQKGKASSYSGQPTDDEDRKTRDAFTHKLMEIAHSISEATVQDKRTKGKNKRKTEHC